MLQRVQSTWNDRKNDKTYMKVHSNHFIFLKADEVIDQVRMICICSNFSYLVIIDFTMKINNIKWMNENIVQVCMKLIFDQMKKECSLIKIYIKLIVNCSKIDAIKQILHIKKHKNVSAFIMFTFSKMILMIEWINQCLVSASAYTKMTVTVISSIEYQTYFSVQLINTDFFV
jgi:hypothetical protein